MKKEKESFLWVSEEIKRYKSLYKGRRYWVFLNEKDNPFEGWTDEYEIIVYDFDVPAIIAVGSYREDGSIGGTFVGGQGVTFHAIDAKGMIAECINISKWYN